MIERPMYLEAVSQSLRSNPVVALLGPRQCGKTTLARMCTAKTDCEFFDLEDSRDLSRLNSPFLALENLTGLVVIDEVQRKPQIFETIRVLVDRPSCEAQFLLLGSAAPRLVREASESLAGRIGFVDLSGFNLSEVNKKAVSTLWSRGGYPRSFLARTDAESMRWRNDFIRTFLERDIPGLGISIPAETLRRFWTMIAHYHGQIWNAAEFARSLGTAEKTARRYLDLLSGTYMVRQLQPWHANLKKRQVKSPKVYIRDTGLLHTLLSLENQRQLSSHPKLGVSFEGFAIEEIIAQSGSRDIYYWATHRGAEIDLLLFGGRGAVGFEIKYTDAPSTTRSMRIALDDLRLEHLYVVYPGDLMYPLDENITVLPVGDVATVLQR